MFKTVSQQVRIERLKICNSCEHNIHSLNTCKLCKCYIPAKTMFSLTTCPDNKWLEENAGTDLISKIEESILELWNKS